MVWKRLKQVLLGREKVEESKEEKEEGGKVKKSIQQAVSKKKKPKLKEAKKIESVGDVIGLIQQQRELKRIFESWAKSEGYVKASDVQKAILNTANRLEMLSEGQNDIKRMIKRNA